ncbi:MAG: hypothetical protein ACU837_07015 [Gammaproteobacteria bacterium]
MSMARNLLLYGALGMTAALPVRGDDTWQNPGLAPNNGNNIHNDSYMSDNYTIPGPNVATGVDVKLVSLVLTGDAATQTIEPHLLGECAAHTFDAAGNLYSICAGIPLNGKAGTKTLVAFDPKMQLLALKKLPSAASSYGLTDFGGSGYYYLDNEYRPVVARADNHVAVYQPQLGTPLQTGTFNAVRNIDLTSYLPEGDKLYACMPDKHGNIWWTSSQGMVGFIAPDNSVHKRDLNDPDGDGVRIDPDAPGYQQITNSLAVDEGDSVLGSSGIYIVTTHKLYRFGVNQKGGVGVKWAAAYKRGVKIKPGQVSRGSGTTPTVFALDGRRYVAIADNATPMNVNIYRAETKIGQETRLFAQVQPFQNVRSADENSLIAYPTPNGVALFAENNWGYASPTAAGGSNTTEPGFARIDVTAAGAVVSAVNNAISIPSVVSKSNSASHVIYTYEKRTDGYWYLTALAPNNINHVVFSLPIGEKSENILDQTYNNHYSGISLAPDGTLYVGSLFGIIQMRLH